MTRLAVFAALLVVTSCTVLSQQENERRLNGESAGAAATGRPENFVDEIWDTELLPTFEREAVDFVELLARLDADPETTEAEHGSRSGTGAFSYMVSGEGEVLSTEGDIVLDLAPADGAPDLVLETGPVILGTAVRDAVGFIKFDDFTNQVDFARVGTDLNKKVSADVIGPLDLSTLLGATLSFRAAYTATSTQERKAVPVKLSVVP